MLQYAMQRHPGMIVDNLVEKNGKKWKNMEKYTYLCDDKREKVLW